ncbi:putative short-chain dehydrogenase/reductase [endosymbiont of Acanthamoeba sp. UWC8]|uniref:SDR family NAD(P)-dependent oxidoreductase n=1 Tax=endosymbiont of Acanthamoeba sp. UWC8 TaxID=86106 RepID=UPI0004D0D48F|nr:SDR family NAD(P)-dependent oxidoreductase [endosymbiont of Acanthamoeba sp. UWC8]AIF81051.1 putative short-chain dehydrogenase/reductase [endosymbiont of Acanthamoeba sp. UWC8]
MTNKTVLVTGAAKRIGREICLFLAQNSYNILLHYNHSSDEAFRLKKEVESLGATCKLQTADFLNEDETNNLFVNEKFDLLINNASIFENDTFKNIDYKSLDKHFKANLYAPILLSQRFFKDLQSEGKLGNIINILDYCISAMPKNFLSYILSKKALWEFTQVAAYEMASHIRVNAIALSNTLKAEQQSEQNFAKSINDSPLRLSPNIEEIYNSINFILNTPSMTGQVLFLDGGKHLNILEQL